MAHSSVIAGAPASRPNRPSSHLRACSCLFSLPVSHFWREAMRSHAIRFRETGGPEKLKWEEVEIGEPGKGEVLLRQMAVGLNYIDTYHRTGLYPVPLPSGIGLEAAGVVEAVGEGVSEFKPGDHAGYCSGPIGAYAEARLFPAERL